MYGPVSITRTTPLPPPSPHTHPSPYPASQSAKASRAAVYNHNHNHIIKYNINHQDHIDVSKGPQVTPMTQMTPQMFDHVGMTPSSSDSDPDSGSAPSSPVPSPPPDTPDTPDTPEQGLMGSLGLGSAKYPWLDVFGFIVMGVLLGLVIAALLSFGECWVFNKTAPNPGEYGIGTFGSPVQSDRQGPVSLIGHGLADGRGREDIDQGLRSLQGSGVQGHELPESNSDDAIADEHYYQQDTDYCQLVHAHERM